MKTQVKQVRLAMIVVILVPLVAATSSWAATPSVQLTKLTASDGAAEDYFGQAVALDGNTAVVGSVEDDDWGDGSGSAYIFTRAGGIWVQEAKLTASDGAAEDNFGNSVALDGDTAVVGSVGDDDQGVNSGSAYIFTRASGIWMQVAKLTASDGVDGGAFGQAVALDGDTTVIGTPFDDDQGVNSGSVYVFTRTGGVWTQEAKLTASDGAAFDQFGYSVALDGDTAVIGVNSGSVYVFTRTNGIWTQEVKLTANDSAVYVRFGYSVALNNDTAMVGAIYDDDQGVNSGSVYVFTRTGNIWTQQAKLTTSDGATNDFFGWSVALTGDTALVGAVEDDNQFENSGSVYVFTRTGSIWTQQAKLTPSDGATNDFFGNAVAFDGNTAVIGALENDDQGDNSGSTYVFGAPPTITIVKDAQPDSNQDFAFSGGLGNFWLDDANPDDGDGFTNAQTFIMAPGSYTVAESVPNTWHLIDIVCDPAANSAVNLANGSVALNVTGDDYVTCTFVNQKGAAIRTVKYEDKNGDGTWNKTGKNKEPALGGWAMTVYNGQGQVAATASTDKLGKANFGNLRPGSYTVCETQQSGWLNTQPGVINPTYNQPCYAFTVGSNEIADVQFGNQRGLSGTGVGNVPSPVNGVIISTGSTDPSKEDENMLEADNNIFLPFINR